MCMKLAKCSRRAVALVAIAFLLCGTYAWAQNLGSAPQTNVAVQGQTGAQPEGAFLNFIDWVGKVIAPVGAGRAVVGAIVAWLTGRGFGRWLFATAKLRDAPRAAPKSKFCSRWAFGRCDVFACFTW